MRDLSTSGKRQVTPILLPLFGPLARCPGCGTPLDGGPVLYRCQACRRAVPAADVDTEYHAPVRRAA
jgi:DNA-directed RNA polymerase subunit RPC12/RpoP